MIGLFNCVTLFGWEDDNIMKTFVFSIYLSFVIVFFWDPCVAV